MTKRRVLARFAALALVGVCVSTVGIASAAPVAWNEVTSPHVSGNASEIYAMTATGANDVWAFGYDRANIAGTYEWRVLGQHWDGSSWTRLNTRDVETAPAQDFIWGASASASNDVWIGGSSLTSVSDRTGRTLVEHWNGSAWSIDNTAPSPGARATVLGLSARTAGDVWAVGEATFAGGPDYNGFVLHRAGGTWTQVPYALAVPGCNKYARGELDAVDAVGENDVYVSGWCQSQPVGHERGFVAHYDGVGWTLVLQAGEGSELTKLATAPDGEVWAGGDTVFRGPNSAIFPLVWHGTATKGFSAVPVRHSPKFGGPLGALSVSAAGVFIAGQLTDPHGNPTQTYALRLDRAGKWRKEPIVPTGGLGYARVHASAVEPGGSLWFGGTAVGGAHLDVQSLVARRAS